MGILPVPACPQGSLRFISFLFGAHSYQIPGRMISLDSFRSSHSSIGFVIYSASSLYPPASYRVRILMCPFVQHSVKIISVPVSFVAKRFTRMWIWGRPSFPDSQTIYIFQFLPILLVSSPYRANEPLNVFLHFLPCRAAAFFICNGHPVIAFAEILFYFSPTSRSLFHSLSLYLPGWLSSFLPLLPSCTISPCMLIFYFQGVPEFPSISYVSPLHIAPLDEISNTLNRAFKGAQSRKRKGASAPFLLTFCRPDGTVCTGLFSEWHKPGSRIPVRELFFYVMM